MRNLDFFTALMNGYDASIEQNLVDNYDSEDASVLPLYHTSMKSNGNDIILATLTKEGELFKAEFVPEKEQIVFPVTNDSVARAGKNPPSHPLVDKLAYLFPDNNELYKMHQATFNAWFDTMSETPEKQFLKIIQSFLEKDDFLDRLLDKLYGRQNYSRKTLKVRYTEKENKEKKIDLSKVFLTFAITDFVGVKTISITDYIDLHKDYIAYVESQTDQIGFCDISGIKQQLTTKHRGLMGNAKLISVSNNIETYKGRFKNGTDMVQIGYQTSEKIHLMLKYLLENQNSRRWLGSQQYLVNWFSDDIANKSEMDVAQGTFLPFLGLDEDETQPIVTLENKKIGDSFIRGERQFSDKANYYVAIIDKASNGRISLKFFRELQASRLLNNLKHWQTNNSWSRYDVAQQKMGVATPSLSQILLTAYGVERNGKLELDNDNFKKDQFQKLVISLIDGRSMPKNVLTALDANIRKRLNYDKTWRQVQFVTLAVFSHVNGEELTAVLDRENKDRSYLYGRLLAVLNHTEAATYTNDRENQRVTNAQKFWTSYTNHPAKTMQTLMDKTKSYEKNLRSTKPGLLIKLDREKQEIINEIGEYYLDSNEANKPLDYHFIFGFYAEQQFLYTKSTKIESEEVADVNE